MIASRPVYPVVALRVVLAAAFMCLLASCPQSIPELRGAVSIRLVSPEGRVLSQSASRTILPDFARLADRIEINRYAPNATTAVATQSFEGLSPINLADIDPGSWEFEAKLYFEDASEPFATGRSAATTIQEGASPTVSIPLMYNYGTGTGGCTITVSWPIADADALSWGLDAMDESGTITGSMTNVQNINTDSSTRSATIAITNAQAGARRLVLAFSKDNQNAGVFTESVNIFAGVAASDYIQAGGTTATISFEQGRLLNSNTSLSGLGLTNQDGQPITLTPDFSSNTYEYTAPVANLSSFSFTPIRSIAGQKITYQWNNTTHPDPIRSGVAQDCAIASNATNTLVITVTAPNGETTQTYTVRFVNSAEIGWELNPVYTHLSLTANETTVRLQRANPGTATVTGTYTTGMDAGSYTWYLDGTALQAAPATNAETWTKSLTDARTYNLYYTATKDGLLYSSNTIVITVLPAATLVYNGNGHTSGTVPSWDGVVTTVVAQGNMVKSGYRFVGWNTDRTATNASVSPSANIPAAVTNNTADVVLYAIWENVAPPPVTNVVITPLSDSLKVSWQDPDVGDLKEVQVILGQNNPPDITAIVAPGVQSVILPGYDASKAAKVINKVYDQEDKDSVTCVELPANFGNMSTFHIDSTTTAAALKLLLEQHPSGIFYLDDDVTLDGMSTTGSDLNPFTGHFYGNGHTIHITNPTSYRGLLSNIGPSGYVGQLTIDITHTTTSGSYTFGALAACNAGKIESCTVQGTISNKSMSYNNNYPIGAGGLVGYNTGIIEYCRNEASITGTFYPIGGLVGKNLGGTISYSSNSGTLDSTEASALGGLVGHSDNGTISFCFSTGSIAGSSNYNIGGLVGLSRNTRVHDSWSSVTIVSSNNPNNHNRGGLLGIIPTNGGDNSKLINCYAIGDISETPPFTEDSHIGGLVGYSAYSITNSYYCTTTSGQTEPRADVEPVNEGTGLSNNELKNQAILAAASWDFDSVWAIDLAGEINGGYPYLQGLVP